MQVNDKTPKLVSVIIPAYNCEDSIAETIDSVLQQTYENTEIIIINDGSTDSTEQVINEFAKKDSRIKSISQENKGVGVTRNVGISHATSDYIFFVDSDDAIERDAIQRLMESGEDADIVIAGIKCIMKMSNGRARVSDINHQDITLSTNADIWAHFFSLLNDGCLNSPCARIYKKSVIEEHNLRFDRDLDMGEDIQFNLDYIEHAANMRVLSGTVYNYHTYRSLLSKKKKDNLYDNRKKSIDLLEKHIRRHNIDCNIIYYMRLKLMVSQAMQEHRNSKPASERRKIIEGLLQKNEIQDAIANYRAEGIMGHIVKRAVASKNARIIDAYAKMYLILSSRIQYSFKRTSI